MPTIVELISPTDTITFRDAPGGDGFVYNNKTLDEWYALPAIEAPVEKRPNAHGAFGLGQIFSGAAKPIVSGKFFGATSADALVARNRLGALFADGKPVTMRVTDELAVTTRQVWLVEKYTPFLYDFAYFPFDLAFVAPDPRRYAALVTAATNLPSGSTGLVWDLGTAVSGLFFDWGTAGTLGQAVFTNTGNAATFPTAVVTGGLASGFRITEIETGDELTYVGNLAAGDSITLDSRTQSATLNTGSDGSAMMTSRDWFSVPPGATRRYQFATLGATSGTPTLSISAAPAYL